MKNGRVKIKMPPPHGNTRNGRSGQNGDKTLVVSKETHRRLRAVAANRDQSIGEFVEHVFTTHLPTYEAEIRNAVISGHSHAA